MRQVVKLGRSPVFVATLLVLSLMGLDYLRTGGGWKSAWTSMQVSAADVTFLDLRVITRTLDCVKQGINAYNGDCTAPHELRYNYPSSWFLFAKVGIGDRHAEILGVLFILAAAASFFLLLKAESLVTTVLAIVALVSPPLLLGLERGNSDVLIFSVLVISFFATTRLTPRLAISLRALIIIVLTALKIFPVAAVVALIRSRLTFIVAVIWAILAIGAFFFIVPFADIQMVWQKTPQDWDTSFGSLPLFLGHKRRSGLGGFTPGLRIFASFLALMVLLTIAGIVLRLKPCFDRFLPRLVPGNFQDDVAVACLSIFLFVFLLGSSYDYRLIFLVGAMGPLLRYFDLKQDFSSLSPALIIVGFLWLSPFSIQVRFFDEILDWIIFAGAAAWLAATWAERVGIFAAELPAATTKGVAR